MEMYNWIGPKVKQVWNNAMHVLHNFLGFDMNTTAFYLGRYSLHILLLKSSIVVACTLVTNHHPGHFSYHSSDRIMHLMLNKYYCHRFLPKDSFRLVTFGCESAADCGKDVYFLQKIAGRCRNAVMGFY